MSVEQAAEQPRRQGLRPETLASSVVLVLLVNLVQRSVGFGRAVLFCRWLDPIELGYWEMAYSFLLLAAPLAVLGLPGSFGRYLEKYRQRGQLRLFLWRTSIWTFLLAGLTLVLFAWQRELVARVVFGDPARAGLAAGTIACLAIVILHHFFEAIFAGLRMFRVVSAMHFVQSMCFAAVSLVLLSVWRQATASLVIGYGAACVVSIVGVLIWSVMRVQPTTDAGDRISHREFWPPLVQFAVWVWVTNLLTNVFGVVDRYMILHFGGFGAGEALVQVGNYHTSIIVPVLLISVTNLVVGAMTPHLSHDWEAGRHAAVGGRVNLAIKLATIGMLAAGIAALAFCPLLFRYGFGDKYAAGLAVMPWTLASCVWSALLLVAQQYVWCAEKSHRATLPLAIGLVSNIGLNLVFLPLYGLQGAVAATAASTLLAMLAQLEVNRRSGMSIHRGTWIITFAPLLLVGGPMVASLGTISLMLMAIARGWVFTHEERAEIALTLAARLNRLPIRLGRPA